MHLLERVMIFQPVLNILYAKRLSFTVDKFNFLVFFQGTVFYYYIVQL
jgi:hypothetical protein